MRLLPLLVVFLLQASAPLTIRIADFAALPMTGSPTGANNPGSLARANVMRPEPGTSRVFVNDLNGPLYILDPATKKFTTYLDFNGRDERTGLFDKLHFLSGFAGGFISFAFDPDYEHNGTFYTIHMEDPAAPGTSMPDKTSVPGLDLTGYEATPAVATPGPPLEREAVLIAWTDTNIKNATFEGKAREILRLQQNTQIHPMGDLIFNPTARAGDADWRVLYIASGDSGSGERGLPVRQNPQRLDTMVGKILRIIPDLAIHTDTSTVSENGRYRIPRDNPFTGVEGARKEIWAYGLRNPHRLTWDVDPADRTKNYLIASVIGLHTWETVIIVRKGANYGYSAREGNQVLEADNRTSTDPLPTPDRLGVFVHDGAPTGDIAPTYPVIQYPHTKAGGDAISGGFVYRGKALPALNGKFIFGDITTGRIWYADFAEMVRADDGKPDTMAALHDVQIEWNDPGDTPDAGATIYPTMTPIVLAGYKARGGVDPDLPGSSTVSGPGRADIRFAVDSAGELFILSKADGVIRSIVGVK